MTLQYMQITSCCWHLTESRDALFFTNKNTSRVVLSSSFGPQNRTQMKRFWICCLFKKIRKKWKVQFKRKMCFFSLFEWEMHCERDNKRVSCCVPHYNEATNIIIITHRIYIRGGPHSSPSSLPPRRPVSFHHQNLYRERAIPLRRRFTVIVHGTQWICRRAKSDTRRRMM